MIYEPFFPVNFSRHGPKDPVNELAAAGSLNTVSSIYTHNVYSAILNVGVITQSTYIHTLLTLQQVLSNKTTKKEILATAFHSKHEQRLHFNHQSFFMP